VALFAGDKAKLGDLFYDSVAARADGPIQVGLFDGPAIRGPAASGPHLCRALP
jgi:hypothetical protein